MSIISFQMKTHSRTDLTKDFLFIHNCAIHGNKPTVLDIVSGKRKEHYYVVTRGNDDCSKMSMESAGKVVEIWNNYNPLKQ